MTYKVSRLDIADYLTDENTITEYLNSVLAEDDTALLISAIGDVAKARGMSQIAELSGLGRESLYKALSSDSKPRFETIIKVLNSLGVTIQFKSKKDNVTEQAA